MNLDVDVLLRLGRHGAAWGDSQSLTFSAATLGWDCHFGFRLSQDSPVFFSCSSTTSASPIVHPSCERVVVAHHEVHLRVDHILLDPLSENSRRPGTSPRSPSSSVPTPGSRKVPRTSSAPEGRPPP
eukprot:5679265-Heterocapsa_arctica.AAC.1